MTNTQPDGQNLYQIGELLTVQENFVPSEYAGWSGIVTRIQELDGSGWIYHLQFPWGEQNLIIHECYLRPDTTTLKQ